MPWREKSKMDARVRFIGDWLKYSELVSFSELCRRHGISRQAGYKWVARYEVSKKLGKALKEESRAPHRHGRATADEVVQLIVKLRGRGQIRMGARKILACLQGIDGARAWPSVSTIHAILQREGLVQRRQRRRRAPLWQGKLTIADSCNRVWRADYKGYFHDGAGVRHEPLTVTDGYSRYLLCLQSGTGTDEASARRAFARLFQRYGLPDVILTDNGNPFVTPSVTGLTRLSLWWTQLGIQHERIAPGCPYQNGSHERFHRTLKEATLNPPAPTPEAQRRRFARFCTEYNELRPHEALEQRTPASVYRPSSSRLPRRPAEPIYPAGAQSRRVRHNGAIKWQGEMVYIGEVLAGHTVGLRQDQLRGFTHVYFHERELGTIGLRDGQKFLLPVRPPPRGRPYRKPPQPA